MDIEAANLFFVKPEYLPTVSSKEADRAMIASATERFLANGGKVRVIPAGAGHNFDDLPFMPETPKRRRQRAAAADV